jgi:hypothetical protein
LLRFSDERKDKTMLEAYIIDELKKREEECETLFPTLELPVELDEAPETLPEIQRGVWTIDFN